MEKIVARQTELSKLERLYRSPKAECLALYGRRRVGKTFLINQFFKDRGLYFEITGIQNASKASQLRRYHREFCNLFDNEHDSPPPKNWDEALDRLQKQVSKVPTDRKVIIFFDELPWLATPKSGLLDEIDYFWNRHFSRMDNVLVIICGSAAAWMIKKIINNKGGLYGRLSELSDDGDMVFCIFK